MKFVPQLQSQLAINKQHIQELENEIKEARSWKTYYDVTNQQEPEYFMHNDLKRLRVELKNYVRIQVALKAILKGQA